MYVLRNEVGEYLNSDPGHPATDWLSGLENATAYSTSQGAFSAYAKYVEACPMGCRPLKVRLVKVDEVMTLREVEVL